MRDAVYRVEQWGHLPKTTTHYFFGSDPLEEGVNRLETESGALAFSDAVLPEELTNWLSYSDNAEIRQGLYQQISSTAINPETGCAIDKSLRAIEVTIPLTLTATITVLNNEALEELNWKNGKTWKDGLESCFKLIRAVGASRSRGLGRVKVTWVKKICTHKNLQSNY
jgi:CRISPR/Cas system CSM-associated protein Csm3 (group 7 of RAMP superfamily)